MFVGRTVCHRKKIVGKEREQKREGRTWWGAGKEGAVTCLPLQGPASACGVGR